MHCAHPDGLGCPILGDELYGRKADRMYLQAQAISFVHPTTGKKMHFELPSAFVKFV
jgi:tRNA pseudouridine32 synthase/23S rRNA pseudouridine746 synthase